MKKILLLLMFLFPLFVFAQNSDLVQVTDVTGVVQTLSLNETRTITSNPDGTSKLLYSNYFTAYNAVEPLSYFQDTTCNLFLVGNVDGGASILINKRHINKVVIDPSGRTLVIMNNAQYQYSLLQNYFVILPQLLEGTTDCGGGSGGGASLWTESMGTIYPTTIANNVGIGVTAAFAPLDIQGSATTGMRIRNSLSLGVYELGITSNAAVMQLRDAAGVNKIELNTSGTSFISGGPFRLGTYGVGNMEEADLGKTKSEYVFVPATDGTLLELHRDTFKNDLGIVDGLLTVEDFGAISGDGLDDAAAFQLAFDYGLQNEVICGTPNGAYNINSAINITTNGKKFIGNNSTLTFVSSVGATNGFSIGTTVEDISFQDANFTALADQQYYGEVTATTLTSNVRYIIANNAGARNVKVINCSFENAANGMKFIGVRGTVRLEDIRMTNNYTDVLTGEGSGITTDTMLVDGYFSDRSLIYDPTQQTHSFYMNGGRFCSFSNMGFKGGTGHSMQIKWSGVGSGETLRENLFIDNIQLDSIDGIYVAGTNNVNIKNVSSVSLPSYGYLFNIQQWVNHVNISNVSLVNEDTTAQADLFVFGAGGDIMKTVTLDNINTTGPFNIECDSARSMTISNSTFLNHLPGLSAVGVNQRNFRMTSGTSKVNVNNCTFIQEYNVKPDAFIFRAGSQIDSSGFDINNCKFYHYGTVNQDRVLYLTAPGAGTPNNFVKNSQFYGYTTVGDLTESDQYHAFNCRDLVNDDWMPDVNDWKPISNYQAYPNSVIVGAESTPVERLDVRGNISLDNTTPILQFKASGALKVWQFASGNDLYFRLFGSGNYQWRDISNNQMMRLDNGQYLTLPTYRFVSGSSGLITGMESQIQAQTGTSYLYGGYSTIDSAFMTLNTITTGSDRNAGMRYGIRDSTGLISNLAGGGIELGDSNDTLKLPSYKNAGSFYTDSNGVLRIGSSVTGASFGMHVDSSGFWNAAALRAAVAYAKANEVKLITIESGLYHIQAEDGTDTDNENIDIEGINNLTIRGSGRESTTLMGIRGSNGVGSKNTIMFRVRDCLNFTLQDMTIRAKTKRPQTMVFADAENHADSSLVIAVQVIGKTGNPTTDSTNFFTVKNVRIQYLYGVAILYGESGGHDVEIVDCIIEDCYRAVNGGTPQPTGVLVNGTNAYNIKVVGNDFRDIMTLDDNLGHALYFSSGASKVLVQNNTFNTTSDAFALNLTGIQLFGGGGSEFRIVNNSFTNSENYFSGLDNATFSANIFYNSNFVMQGCSNMLINGNTFEKNINLTAWVGYLQTKSTGSTDIQITANKFIGWESSELYSNAIGVSAGAGSKRWLISENTFTNWKRPIWLGRNSGSGLDSSSIVNNYYYPLDNGAQYIYNQRGKYNYIANNKMFYSDNTSSSAVPYRDTDAASEADVIGNILVGNTIINSSITEEAEHSLNLYGTQELVKTRGIEVTKTANYTTDREGIINITNGDTITISTKDIGRVGHELLVINSDGTGTVVVNTEGAETINGATQWAVTSACTFRMNGTGVDVISCGGDPNPLYFTSMGVYTTAGDTITTNDTKARITTAGTYTLPSVTTWTLEKGLYQLTIKNASGGAVTLNRIGSDTIYSTVGPSETSISLLDGESVTLSYGGANKWDIE
jgi:hypothetical protein